MQDKNQYKDPNLTFCMAFLNTLRLLGFLIYNGGLFPTSLAINEKDS